MSSSPTSDERLPRVSGIRRLVKGLQRMIWHLSRHWYWLAMLAIVAYLGLGLLPPALMAEGRTEAATGYYRFLALQNHLLPQRSYFLFGEAGGVKTYELDQLLTFGAKPADLQAYLGDARVGYKMGWNHRMLAIWVGLWLGGLIWGLAGKRPQLGGAGLLLLMLPLLLDGFSHLLSESGGAGFRQSNHWAVWLTGATLPPTFYVGTGFNTLNWWLRTVTGALFGLGMAWFLFGEMNLFFAGIRQRLSQRYSRQAGVTSPG